MTMAQVSCALPVYAHGGGTATGSVYNGAAAIGKPERHVRKASHCGSKQQ